MKAVNAFRGLSCRGRRNDLVFLVFRGGFAFGSGFRRGERVHFLNAPKDRVDVRPVKLSFLALVGKSPDAMRWRMLKRTRGGKDQVVIVPDGTVYILRDWFREESPQRRSH